MLIRGLEGSSSSVYVDLLTYSDLESLKSRTGRPSGLKDSTSNLADRRYLIVTYEVEFDKVHYPLPLTKVERIDVESLTALVKKLKAENEALRRGKSSLENDLVAYEHKREL